MAHVKLSISIECCWTLILLELGPRRTQKAQNNLFVFDFIFWAAWLSLFEKLQRLCYWLRGGIGVEGRRRHWVSIPIVGELACLRDGQLWGVPQRQPDPPFVFPIFSLKKVKRFELRTIL